MGKPNPSISKSPKEKAYLVLGGGLVWNPALLEALAEVRRLQGPQGFHPLSPTTPLRCSRGGAQAPLRHFSPDLFLSLRAVREAWRGRDGKT